jgi:hypothetical protein
MANLFNKSKICMHMTELEHWPYKIYQDDSGTLYFHDLEEGLVFQRERTCSGEYGLAVIIEEDNATYPCLTDILSPEPVCGFQVFDKITAGEWSGLVKDYLRHKQKGASRFNAWLKENLYDKI